MNPDIEKMIQLQTVWDGIVRAEKEIEDANRNISENKKKLSDAEASYNTKSGNIKKQKSDLKSKEIKFDEQSLKLEELKNKRLSAANEKQLKAFDNEISLLEEETGSLEDFIIKQMDEIEASEKRMGEMEVSLEAIKNESIENHKILEERIERFSESKNIKENDFKNGLAELTPQAKARFQKLVTSANKKGIVELKNSICLGCNTKVPDNDVSKIKENKDMVNCQNCGKFLYHNTGNK